MKKYQDQKSYFGPKELVSPEIYDIFGDRSIKIFHPEILFQLNRLREAVGIPFIINDWGWGGKFQYSGARPLNAPVGAKNSRHKSLVAFDIKCSDLSKLDEILTTRAKHFKIARIEHFDHTPTWRHIEFSPFWVNSTKVFKP